MGNLAHEGTGPIPAALIGWGRAVTGIQVNPLVLGQLQCGWEQGDRTA